MVTEGKVAEKTLVGEKVVLYVVEPEGYDAHLRFPSRPPSCEGLHVSCKTHSTFGPVRDYLLCEIVYKVLFNPRFRRCWALDSQVRPVNSYCELLFIDL